MPDHVLENNNHLSLPVSDDTPLSKKDQYYIVNNIIYHGLKLRGLVIFGVL